MLNLIPLMINLIQMLKPTETSKPKVSKDFIQYLKNTPQIPQKPKQVPIPASNSQLPPPIIAPNKNKRDEDIKECPIEKICLDKPKGTSKHVTIKDPSLKERKQNFNDHEYDKAYP